MKKIILGLVACLITVAAFATTMTTTWTNPVQNTDNSAIPATGPGSVASSRIEYGTCAGAVMGTKIGEYVVQGNATSGSTPDLAPGTYCGHVFTKNTYGNESAASNDAKVTVTSPTPKAPTNFSFGS